MALDPASCQNSLVLPRRIALLVLAVVWILPLSGVAEAASALTEAEERALAQRFAPVLVFHPEERFFPTSPLFQLADDEQIPREPARTPRAPSSFSPIRGCRTSTAGTPCSGGWSRGCL